MARALRARPARRGDRRRHRRAPADLGRARLAGERERRPQPVHPPGQELPRGPPLHRRPAQPQARRRLDDRAAAPASASTATGSSRRQPAVEARRAHMEDALRGRSAAQASAAATSTWRGTSRSAAGSGSPGGCSGCATRRSPSSATTRPRASPGLCPPGDPHGPPGRPSDHARVRHASRCRASSTRSAARRARASRSPTPRATTRCRSRATRWSPTTTASSARTPPTGQRGWRSTATACSAMPPRSTSRRSARWSSASTSPTARRTGSGCRRWTTRTSFTILNDLSRFPTLTDRLQQAVLNFIYLGRLMRKGFPGDARFAGRLDDRRPVLRRQQPGRDLRRHADRGLTGHQARGARRAGHELLHAAAALDRLRQPTRPRCTTSYPDELERPLLFSLIQQLWDRSDPNGYAQHMTTSPYPNTPAARRADAVGGRRPPGRQRGRRRRGAHDRRDDARHPGRPGRSHDVNPFYAIPRTTDFPSGGSVYEPWDAGAGYNALAPNANTPPVESDDNQDPHGVPRRTAGPRIRSPTT